MSLLKKPIFYISFVVFFVIALYAFWWNFLWLWTYKKGEKLTDVYIKTNVIDNTSIDLVFVWIDLLKWNFSQYVVVKKVLDTLKQAEILIKLDVVGYLLSSSNKSSALELLIIRMEKVVDDLKTLKWHINSYINLYNQRYLSCVSQKNLGDTNFFYWFNNYDYQLLVEWLENSAKGGSCAEENRVKMHAFQIMNDKLNRYLDLLEKKYNIINTNQTLIIQNIELFKDNYLDRLLSLKNAVKGLTYDINN